MPRSRPTKTRGTLHARKLATTSTSPVRTGAPSNNTASAEKPVKVYILAGQYNMVGMGDISGARPLYPSVFLSADPAIVAAHVEAVRIFRGYAGWGAGQLELEIEEGAWLVLDAEIGDVFSDRPDELWHDVLRRQPGRLRWLALAPDDLSSN